MAVHFWVAVCALFSERIMPGHMDRIALGFPPLLVPQLRLFHDII